MTSGETHTKGKNKKKLPMTPARQGMLFIMLIMYIDPKNILENNSHCQNESTDTVTSSKIASRLCLVKKLSLMMNICWECMYSITTA